MKKVAPLFLLLKQAFINLQANDPIRMAGATAFFAFFALPPIVIILSSVLSLLFNDHYQRISGQLFDELADLFGPKSANQLEVISHRIHLTKASFPLTVLSVVLVLVASTTLFAILKGSLNQLWNIKKKSGSSLLPVLIDKLIALTIILGSGFLFSLSLTLEQFMVQLSIKWSFSSITYYQSMANLGHFFTSILIHMIWFAMLFNYLPDAKIAWRVVWPGAFFTSLLFKAGEAILNELLINSQISTLYGKSGAIILLLLFVFYASLLFYYGASFTRQYSDWIHAATEPNDRAVAYTITEV
ncbi:YihY/virulence factor BrkB family protein [Spirosoma sp. HMF3257]|uniref:YihY/virulence factor BrkB family protein n=1 Tax=Spirosoma telluris TaxID=2183553 RepID=A0A327NST7_9BACT|nr:YihY/virulence factor BrkB family protein [Spirosoma telluris]RAI77643.1 YihY/virulence factor BrkB family protein [Spirosoma telluris]